jgi:hypothetical protein
LRCSNRVTLLHGDLAPHCPSLPFASRVAAKFGNSRAHGPEEAGTALALTILKIASHFKPFRPAADSLPAPGGLCDKMAGRENGNEQKDGKIVEEDCVCPTGSVAA